MRDAQISANDILNSLINKQFKVVYQPKFNMETEQISGMEALLRWSTAQENAASTETVIAIAEEYDIITSITLFVLEKVCQDMCDWREKSLELMPVSVNVSRLDLLKTGFVEKVFHLLSMYRIESRHIQLELTETAFVPEPDIISDIEILRTNGIKIAIDDFGTGYSTLAILKTMPVDIMKIDRLFLDGILEDSVAQDILKTIVDLARCMNLSIVYEGVETRKQVEYLMTFGHDLAQGYYYAKPLAKIEMERCMEKSISWSGGCRVR